MQPRRIGAILVPLLALACVSGCTTFVTERRVDTSRRQMEFDSVKLDLQRLKERVDGMAAAQQQLYREVEVLRASVQGTSRDVAAEVERTTRAVNALEKAQQQMRGEIATELSGKLAELMRTQAAGRGTRVEEGYEHIVKAGETLSEIASAYKVRPSVIVKANNLKNPDALQVGQKLFIPE